MKASAIIPTYNEEPSGLFDRAPFTILPEVNVKGYSRAAAQFGRSAATYLPRQDLQGEVMGFFKSLWRRHPAQ
jgi:hypothetical protein